MSYTLGEAAKATGKDRATISRAIKKGKISAARRRDGSYDIDPAELHRWYPPVNTAQDVQSVAIGTPINTELAARMKELEAKLEGLDRETKLLRGQIERLEADKEFLQQQLARTTTLLADQREKASQKPVEGSLTVWQWLGLAKR